LISPQVASRRPQTDIPSGNNKFLKMVEIFRTDVRKKTQSKMLLSILTREFPAFRINFDLSDADKVLRVEGEQIAVPEIILRVREHGFVCEVLE
jgi:hypothetical protein